MKYLYKYPQAAFPYDATRRGESPPRPRRSRSTSCSTPASSTRTATSTSSSSTPRRRPKTSCSDLGRRIAGPKPRRSTCCRRSGSAIPGRGGTTHGPRAVRCYDANGAIDVGTRSSSAARRLECDGAAELLFTENETNAQRLFGVAERDAVRQGRHQRLRRPRRRGRGESGAHGHEGRGALSR